MNLLRIPLFANLEIKHCGKTYYVNREIIKLHSELLSSQEDLNPVILPSIEGPIESLLKFFNGEHVEITKENALFYYIMSTYLNLQDDSIQKAAQKFLPNVPTVDIVSRFFKSLKGVNISVNYEKYSNYFHLIREYLINDSNPYISNSAVDYIIEKNVQISDETSKIIMGILLDDLKEYEDEISYQSIEETIVKFVEKYQTADLYKMLLKCPFFNISKVPKFKEILLLKDFEYNENGYLSTHQYCYNKDFTVETKDCSINGPNSFEGEHAVNSGFSYEFKTFTFDIKSYSFKSKGDYPVEWHIYVKTVNNSEDLEEVHHCANSDVFKNNENEVRFNLDKPAIGVTLIKFVLTHSAYQGDGVESNLKVDDFDIFGTFHESCNFLSPEKAFAREERNVESMLEEMAVNDPLMRELLHLLHLNSDNDDSDSDSSSSSTLSFDF